MNLLYFLLNNKKQITQKQTNKTEANHVLYNREEILKGKWNFILKTDVRARHYYGAWIELQNSCINWTTETKLSKHIAVAAQHPLVLWICFFFWKEKEINVIYLLV